MDTRQQENVPVAQIFSERLAELRGDRSKRAFSKEIGVNSPQTYQHYENGRIPDMDTLLIIADRCAVTVDWLLGRDSAAAPGGGGVPPAACAPAADPCHCPAGVDDRLAAMESDLATIRAQLSTVTALLSGALREGLHADKPQRKAG